MEVDNEGNSGDGKATPELIELKRRLDIGDDIVKRYAERYLRTEKISKYIFYSNESLMREVQLCALGKSVYMEKFILWLEALEISREEIKEKKSTPLRVFYDSIRVQCLETNYPFMLRSRLKKTSFYDFVMMVDCDGEGSNQKMFLTERGIRERDNYLEAMYSSNKIFDVSKVLSLMSSKMEKREENPFQDSDIFLLFNESRVKEYIPTQQYFTYINQHYTLEQRVEMLRNYYSRKCRKDNEDWDYDSYNSNFYHQSIGQTHLYDSLLVPGYKYVIHSDALGIMSMIAISKKIEYVSSEPNQIGHLAKSLGIITAGHLAEDYPDHIHLYLYCYKYYGELPKFKGQKYLVVDNEIVQFPGERISPDASYLGLDQKYLSKIKKSYFKGEKTSFVITNAYPLDAPSGTMLSNMNIPQRPPETAQYIVASVKDIVVAHNIYTRERWKHITDKKWYSFQRDLRYKTVIIPEFTFPYREVGYVWDKRRDYLYDKKNNYESSFSFFLTVPYKEEYVDEYTRNGNFFLFMKKYSNNMTRYIRLKREDQARYNTAVIRVHLVSTIIVRDRRYQVYVQEDETERDHPFVLNSTKL